MQRVRQICNLLRTVMSVLVMATLAMGSFAQTGKGVIVGRVTDPTGAILRAARVEVQSGGQTPYRASRPQGATLARRVAL